MPPKRLVEVLAKDTSVDWYDYVLPQINAVTAREKDDSGKLLLHLAAERDAPVEVIDALILAYPDGARQKEEKYGRLPLHVAVSLGAKNLVITKLLTAYHDGARAKDNRGRLPLHLAAERKAPLGDVLALMSEYPLGIFVADDADRFPIYSAYESRAPQDVIIAIREKMEKFGEAKLHSYLDEAQTAVKDKSGRCVLYRAIKDCAPTSVIRAIITTRPEGIREKDTEKGRIPLHYAADLYASVEVVSALLAAYTDGAKAKDKERRLPLHLAAMKSSPKDVIRALIDAHPDGVKAHDQAERMPLHLAAEHQALPEVLITLVIADLPIYRDKEASSRESHAYSWSYIIKRSQNDPEVAKAVVDGVFQYVGSKTHCLALAHSKDDKGHETIAMAHEDVQQFMYSKIFFCGRYELQEGTPIFRSASAVLLYAIDHGIGQDYAATYTKALEANIAHRTLRHELSLEGFKHALAMLQPSHGYGHHGSPATRRRSSFSVKEVPTNRASMSNRSSISNRLSISSSAKTSRLSLSSPTSSTSRSSISNINSSSVTSSRQSLTRMRQSMTGTKVDELFANFNTGFSEGLSRGEFLSLVTTHFQKAHKVTVKFMRTEEQLENEKNIRSRHSLRPEFVAALGAGLNHEEFAVQAASITLLDGRSLSAYKFGLVVPDLDRTLEDILKEEKPSMEEVKCLLRDVAQALQHCHERGVVHGNLSIYSCVRVKNKMCLADFDAAVSIGGGNVMGSGIASTYSTSNAPPEMFYTLKGSDEDKFGDYFDGVRRTDTQLWEAIKPVTVPTVGKRVVFRTFCPHPRTGKPITDGLPYSLVPASPTIDIWAFGLLLFQVISGQHFYDSSNGDVRKQASTLSPLQIKMRLMLLPLPELSPVESTNFRNLVDTLLCVDPQERLKTTWDRILNDPFFAVDDSPRHSTVQNHLPRVVSDLLIADLPIDEDAAPRHDHKFSWTCFIVAAKADPATCNTVIKNVFKSFANSAHHCMALAHSKDELGRDALSLAHPDMQKFIYSYVYFCGRYELTDKHPVYRSVSSVWFNALDHGVSAEYEAAYAHQITIGNKTKSNEMSLDGFKLAYTLLDPSGGSKSTSEAHLDDLFDETTKAKLEELFSSFNTNLSPGLMKSEITKLGMNEQDFLNFAHKHFGKLRKVTIKFMRDETQYRRELEVRKNAKLDSDFVVRPLDGPSAETFASQMQKDHLQNGSLYEAFKYGLVMPAADRTLDEINRMESLDVSDIKKTMKMVAQALQHCHSKRVVHGNLSLLNVVRIHKRMKLINFDAAAIMQKAGDSYVGSKFSSGYLPPECFYELQDEEEEWRYCAYWEAAKIYKIATSYGYGSFVVRTFRTNHVGNPITEGLPYNLVPATPAIDIWAFGAMLYHMCAGVPLLPVNREDDLADAGSVCEAACWTDQRLFIKVASLNIAGSDGILLKDLLSKILVCTPENRYQDIESVRNHAFFAERVRKDVVQQITAEFLAAEKYWVDLGDIDDLEGPDGPNKSGKKKRPRLKRRLSVANKMNDSTSLALSYPVEGMLQSLMQDTSEVRSLVSRLKTHVDNRLDEMAAAREREYRAMLERDRARNSGCFGFMSSRSGGSAGAVEPSAHPSRHRDQASTYHEDDDVGEDGLAPPGYKRRGSNIALPRDSSPPGPPPPPPSHDTYSVGTTSMPSKPPPPPPPSQPQENATVTLSHVFNEVEAVKRETREVRALVSRLKTNLDSRLDEIAAAREREFKAIVARDRGCCFGSSGSKTGSSESSDRRKTGASSSDNGSNRTSHSGRESRLQELAAPSWAASRGSDIGSSETNTNPLLNPAHAKRLST